MLRDSSKIFATKSLWLIPALTALTAIGAWIKIPLPPVPFTLQTLFVYLSGHLLGAKNGAISQLLFLGIGLMGIPVFSMGGGPGYIMQPTFGYLAAFPLAAFIIGRFIERSPPNPPIRRILLIHITGMTVIFTIGAGYLYFNMNVIMGTSQTLVTALWSGMLLFLPVEIFKIIAVLFLVKKLAPIFNGQGDPR